MYTFLSGPRRVGTRVRHSVVTTQRKDVVIASILSLPACPSPYAASVPLDSWKPSKLIRVWNTNGAGGRG